MTIVRIFKASMRIVYEKHQSVLICNLEWICDPSVQIAYAKA